MSSLTALAEQLLAQCKQLDAYYESKNLPYPSHDHDAISSLPPDLHTVRMSAAHQANELRKLTLGPVITGQYLAMDWIGTVTFRIIYHYKLAKHVPLDGSASYAEIATAANLPEKLVFRFIRNAIPLNIFDETADGRVRHTHISRLLATDQGYNDIVGLHLEEMGLAGARYVEALEKYGAENEEPNKTPMSFYCGADVPVYENFRKEPERARRFGGAMQWLTKDDSWDLRHVIRMIDGAQTLDWKALDAPGNVFLDVGGGNGHVAQFLATKSEHLTFDVQDLPHVAAGAKGIYEKQLAEDPAANEKIGKRITFSGHNFFEPQPETVKADIVFIRWCIHNWPDYYCVKILKNLAPVMKPGSKLLLCEWVLEDKPVKLYAQKMGPMLDIAMNTVCNGGERTRGQFKRLFAEADERYVVEEFSQPEGTVQALVVVSWKG